MTDRKTISVDGMGGDNAPDTVVAGLERFAKDNLDYAFLLHGDVNTLTPLLDAAPLTKARAEVRHTDRQVGMDVKPSQAMRRGKGTSMWNAIEAVKTGDADAAVSAGNTGALMAMAKLILRTQEGLHRPALVANWPTTSGVAAVLDVGANIAADAEQLVEFAIMGEAFSRAVHHKDRPKVGLLNIGSEDMKGHDEVREAAQLIRDCGLDMAYHGFVEGDDISLSGVDVIVTDGFTGNIALKSAEGAARLVGGFLSDALKSGVFSRLGALIAMPALRRFQARMDPRAVNGGVFLGLNGVVVKSHGGTDAIGFANAVRIASNMCESRFADEVAVNLKRLAAASEAQALKEAAS